MKLFNYVPLDKKLIEDHILKLKSELNNSNFKNIYYLDDRFSCRGVAVVCIVIEPINGSPVVLHTSDYADKNLEWNCNYFIENLPGLESA